MRMKKIDRSINDKLKSLPSYVSEWNLNMKAARRTAQTRRTFVYQIAKFLSFINPIASKVTFKEMNDDTVTAYYISTQTKNVDGKEVPTSDSYQIEVWSCLNNFFNFLKERGYIKKNYISTIKKPQNRDLDRINKNRYQLTEQDFQAIYRAVDEQDNTVERLRDKAIMLTFMTTGMRETALMNIEMSDVNLDNRTLTVIDKETKTHEYVINDILYDALKEWIEYRWVYNNEILPRQSCQSSASFFPTRNGRITCSAAYPYISISRFILRIFLSSSFVKVRINTAFT